VVQRYTVEQRKSDTLKLWSLENSFKILNGGDFLYWNEVAL